MASIAPQALRMAVIQAVTTDGRFRDALTKDGATAIQARVGAQAVKPRVSFEQEQELSLVIPQQTEKLVQVSSAWWPGSAIGSRRAASSRRR